LNQPLEPIEFIFKKLDRSILNDALALLEQYGMYMYHQLGLTAGKENFYCQMNEKLLVSYGTPENIFLVGYGRGQALGCVAVKRWDNWSCELKRMFVLPEHRFKGLGRLLLKEAIKWAKERHYRQMLLDTNAEMEAAICLYRQEGFIPCKPYCVNENKNVIYLKKKL